MALCSATRRDGQSCAAQALAGSDQCFFHSTHAEHKRQRQRGRRAGGLTIQHRHKAVLPADIADVVLESPSDVAGLLALTISQLRRGVIEVRIANAVAYISGVALNAMEQAGGQARVAKVEFIVQGPVPCPQCKTEQGKECPDCNGMGWVRAPEESSAANQA